LIKTVVLVAMSFLIICTDIAQAAPEKFGQYSNNPVVATVDGKSIFLDDLKTPQMHELMLQIHEMQNLALKKKMLEMLKEKHPELSLEKVPKVSDQEIVHFYENTPGVQEFGSLETMKNQIRSYLQRALEETLVEARYVQALKKGWGRVFLTPPSDFHVEVPVNTAQLRFDDEDKPLRRVFLLEFSDFQCPFCKRVQTTLSKLRKRYARSVQFGYRHFPLPIHKQASALAQAAECAGDQGRFWELHTLFFTQSSVAADLNRVMGLVKQAGVKNPDEFIQCWSGGKYRDQVKNDIREGVRIGVESTPTFILGLYNPKTGIITGDLFSGAVPEEEFARSIEKYLSILDDGANLKQ
jgi:protein-disulfide isomerase